MNIKEAYELAKNFAKGRYATYGTEYNEIFTFVMIPDGYDTSKGPLFDSAVFVDKATGSVGVFNPLMLSPAEFNSGKKISLEDGFGEDYTAGRAFCDKFFKHPIL